MPNRINSVFLTIFLFTGSAMAADDYQCLPKNGIHTQEELSNAITCYNAKKALNQARLGALEVDKKIKNLSDDSNTESKTSRKNSNQVSMPSSFPNITPSYPQPSQYMKQSNQHGKKQIMEPLVLMLKGRGDALVASLLIDVNGATVNVHKGDIANGWKIKKITPDGVEATKDGETKFLGFGQAAISAPSNRNGGMK